MRQCVLAILLNHFPSLLLAATIHVPGDQPTIQAGIDAAIVGDTVLVACGTYHEYNIELKSGLVLTSETGEVSCVVIDAIQGSYGFIAEGVDSTTEIAGFTITGASNHNHWDGEIPGGGMYCFESNLTIRSCRFYRNWNTGGGTGEPPYEGRSGGGLQCRSSWNGSCSPILIDCIFEENSANSGGGMSSVSAHPKLYNCIFSDNYTDNNGMVDDSFSGGALRCGAITLEGCIFVENEAYNSGGAISSNSSQLSILNCTFSNNTAYSAGAVFAGGGEAFIENSTFQSNSAIYGHGGGLVLYVDNSTLSGCQFIQNTSLAGGHSGGAVYCGGDLASFSNCTFSQNTASYAGGGVYAIAPTHFANCTFYENAASRGGGVFIPYDRVHEFDNCIIAFASNGGGIECDYSVTSPPILTCCDVYGNEDGDWVGCISDQFGVVGNFSADPLFCDPQEGDFNIHEESPCNPQNNDCGVLLGAFPVGCAFGSIVVEVEPLEVGEVGWMLEDPVGGLIFGQGDEYLESMVTGVYWITWDDVSGWVTPVAEAIELEMGGVITFYGLYHECIVSADGTGYFQDIQSAIDSFPLCTGNIIYLSDGLYTGQGNIDLNFQGKPVTLASLSGNADACIINCQGTESEPHRGFLFQSGETSESVIEGITIIGGYAVEGGAIKCENGSSPTIRNCVLRDNYATSGGAIYSEGSSPTIENCTISYNTSPTAGAAFLLYSDPIFENCILSHSIDGPAVFGYESFPALSCTDVVWNEGGDWVGCIADQQNQSGNFSNTPAFCDPETSDFRLQPGSPCLPEHNDCGVLVGALGEGDCLPTGVEEVPSNVRVALSAFPNPFNPHLTIMYSLPAQAQGSLVVHDVSGRLVRMLKDGQFIQGANEMVWNGQDDHGQDVASGVYFVRLITEEHQESKKAVLLR